MYWLGSREHESSLALDSLVKHLAPFVIAKRLKELFSCVGPLRQVFIIFVNDTDVTCDSSGSLLDVTSNHDDEDTSLGTLLNTQLDLWSGWVQDTHDAQEDWLTFQLLVVARVRQQSMTLVALTIVIG